MCRIFGFRSVLFSKVHSSLVSAENALMGQSRRHPDGWGLVYYIADTPHVVKSTVSAESDELFQHLSGIVTSQTVLAHIRKATQGKLTLLNTHPFQFGRWTFAHNGNIKNFAAVRERLADEIDDSLKSYSMGETDSELFFFILLSFMSRKVNLHDAHPDINKILEALGEAMIQVCDLIGPLTLKDTGIPSENYLTFVLANGPIMIALNGGMNLYYSTHKKKCPERDTCGSFAPWCEALPAGDMKINHLIFSSEPLQGENVWLKMKPGEMIGVDEKMKIVSKQVLLPFEE